MTRKPRTPAWQPATYTARQVDALRAVYAGEADPHQQRVALSWIIEECAQTYDIAFRSDADGGERETAFALGRQYVGREMVKLINASPEFVAKIREQDGG